MGAEQYPYDPALKVEDQYGLDKLRCVDERDWARVLFKLYGMLAPEADNADWDPSLYDPDDVHDPVAKASDESDRRNAVTHFAWKQFYRNLDEYERTHGKRITQAQRQAHVYKFGQILRREYGIIHASSEWEDRRKMWEERVTGRGFTQASP